MGKLSYSSVGYENTNYAKRDGLTGVKKPLLQMSIKLLINQPPPPLFLFINPQSMNINTTKKVTPQRVRTNYVTSGYTIQHAFDELDIMSVSGITAMVYDPTKGLSSNNAIKSAGYDQYAKLLAMYRNNGVNYNRKQDSVIDSIGRVAIFYDKVEYRGSFDEFNWTHNDESPFNYQFSWTFTISETIDSNLYRGYSL